MNFLPIAIIAYTLNGITTVIDKILIKNSVPSPFVYTFYISVLGALVIFLIPFGVIFEPVPITLAVISGVLANIALLTYFQALKKGEASVVSPIVGGLNPLFSLIIGGIFLGQLLNPTQLMAFFLLLLGAVILTANIWKRKLAINHQLLLMVISGLFFGLSYVFLRETFLSSNFLTGIVISRLAGLAFVLTFLFYPKFVKELTQNKAAGHGFLNKTSLLLLTGQTLGASGALLINFAITMASPALVNSLFGFQYLVILSAAIFLAKEHHSKLLDENLTKRALVEKIIGAAILSIGVYLLSK